MENEKNDKTLIITKRLSGGGINKKSKLSYEVEFRKCGFEVVSSLGGELSSVQNVASMDSNLLSKEVEILVTGLTKVGEVVNLNERDWIE